MPAEQNAKGGLVSLVAEPLEQILVGQLPPPLVFDNPADHL
jgi:hypothetical protein